MKKKAKKSGAASKTKGKAKSAPKKALKNPAKVLKTKSNNNSKVSAKGASKIAKVSAKPAKAAQTIKAPKVSLAKTQAPVEKVAPVLAKAKGKLTKEEKKAQVLAQIAATQKEEPVVVLTNADGKQYCKAHDCDQGQTTEGYCRLHYIALWKRNRSKVKILEGGKLDKYIEDLTSKYPDKYLEMLRKDLSNEKDFNLIVAEMDVEDSGDEEAEEDTSRFIEEVRGGVPTADDDDGGF